MPRITTLRFAALILPLLLAGCASTRAIEPQLAAATTDFTNAQRIEIRLDNFSFTPKDLRLAADRPVALVVVNSTSGGHNFTAPEFFAAARIRPQDAEIVASGQIEVRGGQSVTLYLVPTAGSYDLTCTHMGHTVLGMRGSIEVS